ncbi:helix-turn-helix transcriptional regulator [Actinocrispum wychmicini]|uniref:Helix-turn-helix protein n=1 Tax=Actinocrispum wychmicini TaxID=1213861 RepID=A0A4R2JTG2_9PSEU|nr:helix-turn-helix transcriptional regulator [Actinocrispum wychmicini]TCO62272.1 helix-turn-helix protein [Actinocrispum wychmicini]
MPSVRRQELAAFLRTRRARLTPADLGLPAGAGRRTPGLRREEVALLSGVGLTWYTWLEQGRPINASVQILDAVARTLRLDHAERAHLYRLAEVPSLPEPAQDVPEVQEILDNLALPACVLNARYDVLAWNAPYAVLWARTLSAPLAERNILWQSFMIPPCCTPFAQDRELELRDMVSTFRAGYGRRTGDPDWTDLIGRLSLASKEFRDMWAAQDVRAPTSRVKVYRHASAGDFGLTVTGFDLADLRMTVYTPADDESRERVAWLLDHPDAPPADHTHP